MRRRQENVHVDLPDAGREPGAGETLMDGERDLHVFLDAVDDMVVVATPDGRIVHANPALTKKLG
ncbi:MAG: PAS domain-containing protein, partial [Chloroflexota bacterium]